VKGSISRSSGPPDSAGIGVGRGYGSGGAPGGPGEVVFISSVADRLRAANGAPYNQGAPYSMAKAALDALAKTSAREEQRQGIHVNVVVPGLVDTEMGRRLVKEAMGIDDVSPRRRSDGGSARGRGRVVAFLCSEEAGYPTGQVIEGDGGG